MSNFNSEIRKITIGVDYKSSMHYIVGQKVLESYTVHAITRNEDLSFSVWIDKDNEVFVWKEINKNLPIVLEFNINF